MWLGLFNYPISLGSHHLKYPFSAAPERSIMYTLGWNRTMAADSGRRNTDNIKRTGSALRGSFTSHPQLLSFPRRSPQETLDAFV